LEHFDEIGDAGARVRSEGSRRLSKTPAQSWLTGGRLAFSGSATSSGRFNKSSDAIRQAKLLRGLNQQETVT
jgi:hypothetical protein